jgi:hypothetical protein
METSAEKNAETITPESISGRRETSPCERAVPSAIATAATAKKKAAGCTGMRGRNL